jgi:hypothetical protein
LRPFATFLCKKVSSEIIATYLDEKLSMRPFATFPGRSSPEPICNHLGKKLSSKIIATYLGEKLSHETVPLSAVLVLEAVGPVIHPLERVVELWDTHKN